MTSHEEMTVPPETRTTLTDVALRAGLSRTEAAVGRPGRRIAQATWGSFGLIQPRLYRDAATGAVAPGFRDVTAGNNGAYSAGPGWDACTGLGVPVGEQLLAALRGEQVNQG